MTGRARIAIASGATVVSLGVLGLAWFITGSRAVREESARVERGAIDIVREAAAERAATLAARLDALRRTEARRSYLDYTSHDEDSADCACGPVSGSPLAEGPADPLIWAHFEIDEYGQVRLPTAVVSEAGRHAPNEQTEREIREQIECAALDRFAGSNRGPVAIELARGAFPPTIVTVGALTWRTARFEDEPALVALREVATAEATIAQGFVVRRAALESLVAGSRWPVTVRDGTPEAVTEAQVTLDGDPWTVTLDPKAEIDDARAAGAGLVRRFRRTFAAGLLCAAIAGSLIVGLVAQSERLARDRGRFAAAAAHELRTPLTGLRLYGEMLADGTGDPARAKEYAGRLAGEAERLGRVVTNLIDFARIERGGLTRPSTEYGEIEGAVRESIERFRAIFDSRGAPIELNVRRPLPCVEFDRDGLDRIVQNLLDNAEKYSRHAEDRTIRVGLTAVADGVELSVADRGPGIPPGMRRRMFRPFFRGTGPDDPAGLGLGLALVRELAEAQRARVRYSVVDGGGARFAIRFPAS